MSRAEPITLAIVTKPHLSRLKNLIPKCLPYVDRVVLIIGEKDEPTISWLRGLGNKKIEVYYYKWRDNFADSWNAYLTKITTGWVVIVDDDEIPSEPLLKSLDDFVNDSERGEKYCCVEFRCNPISEGQDMGPCNYWRQIFFRYNPGMHYRGGVKTGCHQFMVGYQNNKLIRSDLTYYHVKSLRDEYRNASRNMFIYSIWEHGATDGYVCPEWTEMKEIIRKAHPEVEAFPDLDRLLEAGTVCEELKQWMVGTYDAKKNDPLYNEIKALPMYFFIYLHPEEAEKYGFIK